MLEVAQFSNSDSLKCSGIEIDKSLIWQKWEPGGEYTKKLTIKNIDHINKKRIKYKVPRSKHFDTIVYPQSVTLNPGTSYSLPVIFKPLEHRQYDDKIVFEIADGQQICVPIKAELRKPDVAMPEKLHFGYCAVSDSTFLTFGIKNLCDEALAFKWELPPPFSISPSQGEIQPRSSIQATVNFTPTASLFFDAAAVISFKEEQKILKLEGIGKYPYLTLEKSMHIKESSFTGFNQHKFIVDFGSVAVGSTCERVINIENLTNVNAPFFISARQISVSLPRSFVSSLDKGSVKALGKIPIKLSFSPLLANENDVEYFTIATGGEIGKIVIKCIGYGIGPQLKISCNHIQFGIANPQQIVEHTFTLSNFSKAPGNFQFLIDNAESVFELTPSCGTVYNGKDVIVHSFFQPLLPMVYHRKVTLLIDNQEPIVLDLLGCCHSLTEKPAEITIKQLNSYRKHIQRGISMFPPDQIADLLNENKLVKLEDGTLKFNEFSDDEAVLEEPPDESESKLSLFFNDGYSGAAQNYVHVAADKTLVDFGLVQDTNLQYEQTLNITNNTKGRIIMSWRPEKLEKSFNITPQQAFIPPLKSFSFRVKFKPGKFNGFFGAELEGFACHTAMMDYTNITEDIAVPPWCLNVRAIGHTFKCSQETFAFRGRFSTQEIVMAPRCLREEVFRTFTLFNESDNPLHFNYYVDQSKTFIVKPSKGLIPPLSHQIFVAKFCADQVKPSIMRLICGINLSQKYRKLLNFIGTAEGPLIVLDNGGTLYLKPTVKDTLTSRKYPIRNVSRLHLKFEWKTTNVEKKFLEIYPKTGFIKPNEIQNHVFELRPNESRPVFMAKPKLIVTPTYPQKSLVRRMYQMNVISEQASGEVKCECSVTNFGPIVCGSSQVITFIIYNSTPIDTPFRLVVEQEISGSNYLEEDANLDPVALELSPSSGVLIGRTHFEITATMRPLRRLNYEFLIKCSTSPHKQRGDDWIELCTLTGQGTFPALQVVDAQCYGAAKDLAKPFIWSLLQIDWFNQVLDAEPEGDELRYSVVSRLSTTSCLPMSNRSPVVFNFGSAPTNVEPSKVTLMLQNVSLVSAQWSFFFPSDLQLELDYWALTGEYTDKELHEMLVIDNQLFDIEPKSGSLEPGQRTAVTFTYKHLFAGTDRIPVLLKLNRGREIIINLIGVTMEPKRPYLHFPASVHQFHPISVSGATPPNQIYELYNGGAVPVTFSMDLSSLDAIQEANYNCRIFECLLSSGVVEPGKTVGIPWIFSPLETIKYSVDVPIHIEGADTAVVTFEGIGYDSRDLCSTLGPEYIDSVPPVQQYIKPHQVAFLSIERLSFGDIPLFSRGRRITFLNNKSHTDTITFKWKDVEGIAAVCINIEPKSGIIEPRQSVAVQIVFTAKGFPTFYDTHLVCEINNFSKQKSFACELKAWDSEKQRQREEFTVTQENVHIEGMDCTKEVGQPMPRSVTPKTPTELDFKRYQTLPPIRKTRGDKDHRRSNKKPSANVAEDGTPLWDKPVPPEPFIIHLSLTARTHTVEDYQENFLSNDSTYFLDRFFGRHNLETLTDDYFPTSERVPHPPTEVSCDVSEYNLTIGVVSSLLKTMLSDTMFLKAIKEINNEPIPYFVQLVANSDESKPSSESEKPSQNSSSAPTMESSESTNQKVGTSSTPQLSGEANDIEKFETLSKKHSDNEDLVIEELDKLRSDPEMAFIVEKLLENTILNLARETDEGQLNITGKSRLIAEKPTNITVSNTIF